MRFSNLKTLHEELETEYPYVVTMCKVQNPFPGNHMHLDWLRAHVDSERYASWINDWPTYRFKRESDAVKFSLAFT